MRRRLRRFVAVGLLITAAHLGLLVGLATGTELPLPVAAAAAVIVAMVLSFVAHRLVTFAADTYALVDHRPQVFLRGAGPAAIADVAVFSLITIGWVDPSAGAVILAEIPALVVAMVIRLILVRRVLFSAVRAEQERAASRAPVTAERRASVVVPVYKDAENIGENVSRLRRELEPLVGAIEIVVVDDGSGDDTPESARSGGADQVLVQPENRGKGAAVRRGMLEATGATVLFTDADLAYPPEQMAMLIEEVEAGWDVVVGSRRHPDSEHRRGATRLRELGSVGFNLVTHVVLLGVYRDTQCGLKAFRRDVAQVVFSRTTIDGFAFDVEVLHLVERDRLTLREVPVVLEDHETSTISILPVALKMIRDVLRVRRQGSHGLYDLPEPLDQVLARAG